MTISGSFFGESISKSSVPFCWAVFLKITVLKIFGDFLAGILWWSSINKKQIKQCFFYVICEPFIKNYLDEHWKTLVDDFHCFRNSRSQIFLKVSVLKKIACFTGKHLCWSLSLIKLQTWKPFFKKDFNTDVFL